MRAPTEIFLRALQNHLWGAANILRGPVDATDFKTYVFPPLFLKRISDMHEDERASALLDFGGDEEATLFLNSPMGVCVVVCRTAKPTARQDRILFFNAVKAVNRERTKCFLTNDHIKRIAKGCGRFKTDPTSPTLPPCRKSALRIASWVFPCLFPLRLRTALKTTRLEPANRNSEKPEKLVVEFESGEAFSDRCIKI